MDKNNISYDEKYKEMQAYLPFLDEIITRIESTPSDDSQSIRSIQLTKMKSLKALLCVTDKKMKIENLLRCEQMLKKLKEKIGKYQKRQLSPNACKLNENDSSISLERTKKNKGGVERITNFCKEYTDDTTMNPKDGVTDSSIKKFQIKRFDIELEKSSMVQRSKKKTSKFYKTDNISHSHKSRYESVKSKDSTMHGTCKTLTITNDEIKIDHVKKSSEDDFKTCQNLMKLTKHSTITKNTTNQKNSTKPYIKGTQLITDKINNDLKIKDLGAVSKISNSQNRSSLSSDKEKNGARNNYSDTKLFCATVLISPLKMSPSTETVRITPYKYFNKSGNLDARLAKEANNIKNDNNSEAYRSHSKLSKSKLKSSISSICGSSPSYNKDENKSEGEYQKSNKKVHIDSKSYPLIKNEQKHSADFVSQLRINLTKIEYETKNTVPFVDIIFNPDNKSSKKASLDVLKKLPKELENRVEPEMKKDGVKSVVKLSDENNSNKENNKIRNSGKYKDDFFQALYSNLNEYFGIQKNKKNGSESITGKLKINVNIKRKNGCQNAEKKIKDKCSAVVSLLPSEKMENVDKTSFTKKSDCDSPKTELNKRKYGEFSKEKSDNASDTSYKKTNSNIKEVKNTKQLSKLKQGTDIQQDFLKNAISKPKENILEKKSSPNNLDDFPYVKLKKISLEQYKENDLDGSPKKKRKISLEQYKEKFQLPTILISKTPSESINSKIKNQDDLNNRVVTSKKKDNEKMKSFMERPVVSTIEDVEKIIPTKGENVPNNCGSKLKPSVSISSSKNVQLPSLKNNQSTNSSDMSISDGESVFPERNNHIHKTSETSEKEENISSIPLSSNDERKSLTTNGTSKIVLLPAKDKSSDEMKKNAINEQPSDFVSMNPKRSNNFKNIRPKLDIIAHKTGYPLFKHVGFPVSPYYRGRFPKPLLELGFNKGGYSYNAVQRNAPLGGQYKKNYNYYRDPRLHKMPYKNTVNTLKNKGPDEKDHSIEGSVIEKGKCMNKIGTNGSNAIEKIDDASSEINACDKTKTISPSIIKASSDEISKNKSDTCCGGEDLNKPEDGVFNKISSTPEKKSTKEDSQKETDLNVSKKSNKDVIILNVADTFVVYDEMDANEESYPTSSIDNSIDITSNVNVVDKIKNTCAKIDTTVISEESGSQTTQNEALVNHEVHLVSSNELENQCKTPLGNVNDDIANLECNSELLKNSQNSKPCHTDSDEKCDVTSSNIIHNEVDLKENDDETKLVSQSESDVSNANSCQDSVILSNMVDVLKNKDKIRDIIALLNKNGDNISMKMKKKLELLAEIESDDENDDCIEEENKILPITTSIEVASSPEVPFTENESQNKISPSIVDDKPVEVSNLNTPEDKSHVQNEVDLPQQSQSDELLNDSGLIASEVGMCMLENTIQSIEQTRKSETDDNSCQKEISKDKYGLDKELSIPIEKIDISVNEIKDNSNDESLLDDETMKDEHENENNTEAEDFHEYESVLPCPKSKKAYVLKRFKKKITTPQEINSINQISGSEIENSPLQSETSVNVNSPSSIIDDVTKNTEAVSSTEEIAITNIKSDQSLIETTTTEADTVADEIAEDVDTTDFNLLNNSVLVTDPLKADTVADEIAEDVNTTDFNLINNSVLVTDPLKADTVADEIAEDVNTTDFSLINNSVLVTDRLKADTVVDEIAEDVNTTDFNLLNNSVLVTDPLKLTCPSSDACFSTSENTSIENTGGSMNIETVACVNKLDIKESEIEICNDLTDDISIKYEPLPEIPVEIEHQNNASQTFCENTLANKSCNLPVTESNPGCIENTETSFSTNGPIQSISKSNYVCVGHIGMKKISDEGVEYICMIQNCSYVNNFYFLFSNHLLIAHHTEVWNGFCKECDKIVVEIASERHSYVQALDHMVCYHVKIHSENGLIDIICKNNSSNVTKPPMIRVRPIADLLSNNYKSNAQYKTPTSSQSFTNVIPHVENVGLHRPNYETRVDNFAPGLPKTQQYTNSAPEKPQSSIMLGKGGMPYKPELNKNIELFQCAVQECSISTDCYITFYNHLKGHSAKVNSKESNSNNFLWHTCVYCMKNLPVDECLLDHLMYEHGHCRYKCQKCIFRGASFIIVFTHSVILHPEINDKFRVVHIPKYHNVRAQQYTQGLLPKQLCFSPYICTIKPPQWSGQINRHGIECGKVFYESQSFRRHILEVHNDISISCQHCKGPVMSSSALISHLRSAHDYYLYKCAYCFCGADTQFLILCHLTQFHPSRMPIFYIAYHIPGFEIQSTPEIMEVNLDTNLRYHLNVIFGLKINLNECYQNLDSINANISTNIEFEVNSTRDISPNILSMQSGRDIASSRPSRELSDCNQSQLRHLLNEKRFSTTIMDKNEVVTSRSGNNMLAPVPSNLPTNNIYPQMHYQNNTNGFSNMIVNRGKEIASNVIENNQNFNNGPTNYSPINLLNKFTESHQSINNVQPTNIIHYNIDLSTGTLENGLLRTSNDTQIILNEKNAVVREKSSENNTNVRLVDKINNLKRFGPDDINKLPVIPILTDNILCSLCSFSTNVTPHMLQHLQLHAKNIAVPSTGPVTPTYHFQTNEMHPPTNYTHSSNAENQICKPAVSENTSSSEISTEPEKNRFVCGSKNCLYVTSNEITLLQHWETLHKNENMFHCIYCAKDVKMDSSRHSTTIYVADHFRLHEETLDKCQYLPPTGNSVCQRITETPSNGVNNINSGSLLKPDENDKSIHAWGCSTCEFSTSSKKEIIEHSNVHPSSCLYKISVQSEAPKRKNASVDKTLNKKIKISNESLGNTFQRDGGNIEKQTDLNRTYDWPFGEAKRNDFVCPFCKKFSSPLASVMKHHLCEELNYKRRWYCDLCSHMACDLKNIRMHSCPRLIKPHVIPKIKQLDPDLNLEKWINDCLNYQANTFTSSILHLLSKSSSELFPTSTEILPASFEPNIEHNLNTEEAESCIQENVKIVELSEKSIDAANGHLENVSDISSADNGANECLNELITCDEDPNSLLKPIETGKSENFFHCLYCNYITTSLLSLKRHKKQHIDILPYKCKYCSDFQCVQYEKLENHCKTLHPLQFKHEKNATRKSDQEEKNFACLFCNSLLRADEIDVHHSNCHSLFIKNMIVMKTTQVHKCSLCLSKFYPDLLTLQIHYQISHPGEGLRFKKCAPSFINCDLKKTLHIKNDALKDSYLCPYCPNMFKNVATLHSHHKKKHSREILGLIPLRVASKNTGEIKKVFQFSTNHFQCVIVSCNAVLDNFEALKMHVKNHYCFAKCVICNKCYQFQNSHAEHFKAEHPLIKNMSELLLYMKDEVLKRITHAYMSLHAVHNSMNNGTSSSQGK